MLKFKNFLSNLKNHIILILLVGFTLGSLGASYVFYYYNPRNVTYEITFKTNKDIDLSIQYIESIKDIIQQERNDKSYVDDNGVIKYPYSSFEYVDVYNVCSTTTITYYEDYATIKTQTRNFNTWQQARRFLRRIVTETDEDAVFKLADNSFSKTDNFKDIDSSSVVLNEGKKEYVFFILFFLVGVGFMVVVFGIFTFFNKNYEKKKFEYDNISVYRTPFHISYFKASLKETKSVRNIVTIAILFSLMLCTKFISIPSGFSNLGIGFGYLVFSVIAMLYGPSVGIIIGMFSDILGFIIKPDGIFFIGYTLSSMIAGLTYSLCLYKTKITFMKCLLSRIVVNLFVNTILGTLWIWLINDRTISFKTYLLLTELPKNLVYLFPQAILMFILIKSLSSPLKAMGLMNEQIAENITIL